jgi:hypothetical protein
MSIAALKKIAIADENWDSIRQMPKVTVADLIARRVDPSVPKGSRLTYDEIAERSGGRISSTHVNDLKNKKKFPEKLTVEKVVGLARGLGESPVVVFEAASGDLQPGLKEPTLAKLLADFSALSPKQRENVEFAVRMLRERIDEANGKGS